MQEVAGSFKILLKILEDLAHDLGIRGKILLRSWHDHGLARS